MNVLIIGTGAIALRHLVNIHTIYQYKFKVNIVDITNDNFKEAKAKGASECFDSIADALKQQKYNFAVICSPTHLHILHALELANAGIHLFIEKPICAFDQDSSELVRIITNRGLKCMVGCNLRFHPAIKCIKDLIDKKVVGRPVYGVARFSHYLPRWRPNTDYTTTYSAIKEQGGGIVLDAIHEPDYLSYLFGEPVSIDGYTYKISDLDINVEDLASYSVRHSSGFVSVVIVDYIRQDKFRGLEIIGQNGTIVWESIGKNPENINVTLITEYGEKREKVISDMVYDANEQYLAEINYFVDIIAGDLNGEIHTPPSEADSLLRQLHNVVCERLI